MENLNFLEIIEKLNAIKQEHEAFFKKWECVTLEKKKDGSEFVNLWQALKCDCAKIEGDSAHLELHIYTKCGYKYIEDFIYLYEYEAGEGRIFNGRNIGLRDTWTLTRDEMRKKIAKRADYHLQQIKNCEKQIKIAEPAFLKYEKAIKDAEKALKIDCGCNDDLYPNSLYFAIKDEVRP